MERLSDETLTRIRDWALKAGLVLFIDTDHTLKIYPKSNLNWERLQLMLYGRHEEMRMFLIRDTQGEE